MIYRKFGKTDINASAIGMGTWNIGNQWGELDDATSYATIRAALDCGVNMFDTADSYGIPGGLSEERLGIGLVGKRRDVHIITKFGNWAKRFGGQMHFTSKDIVISAAHASLFRLRTDYLDVALCHLGNLKAEEVDVWLEGFEELKRRGLLRYYGISTDSLEVLKNFNKNGTCSVVEVDYSLINKAPEAELFPYCIENGIAVLVRGPLYKGLLSGKYDRNSSFTDTIRRSWKYGETKEFTVGIEKLEKISNVVPKEKMLSTALKYVISHPVAAVAIPGAKSPEQMRQNAAAGESLLTEEEYKELQII